MFKNRSGLGGPARVARVKSKYSKALFISLSFIRLLHLYGVLVRPRVIPFSFNAKTFRLYGYGDFGYTSFLAFLLSIKKGMVQK